MRTVESKRFRSLLALLLAIGIAIGLAVGLPGGSQAEAATSISINVQEEGAQPPVGPIDPVDPVDPIVPVDPEVTYVLTSRVDGDGGRISPSGIQIMRQGASQSFTIIANDGYTVDQVTVNGNEANLTRHDGGYWSFTISRISANMNVVARFRSLNSGEVVPPVDDRDKPVVVEVSSQGPGRVYPTGRNEVARGARFSLTVLPGQGAALQSLTSNGVDVTAAVEDGMYALEEVTADVSIVAVFANDGSGPGETPPGTQIVVKPDPGKTIDKIELLDHTIEFEYDENGEIDRIVIDRGKVPGEQVFDIVPAGDKQQIADALEVFNKLIDKELGYDPPRESGEDRGDGNGKRPDYVAPGGDDGDFDGSFIVTIPDKDADGNEVVDPGFNVGTEGDPAVPIDPDDPDDPNSPNDPNGSGDPDSPAGPGDADGSNGSHGSENPDEPSGSWEDNDPVMKAFKRLQALAQTGDLAFPATTLLAAVACAAAGAVLLLGNRRCGEEKQ